MLKGRLIRTGSRDKDILYKRPISSVNVLAFASGKFKPRGISLLVVHRPMIETNHQGILL